MNDPRMPYAVEADRAYQRGEWLFAEVARQRGAELVMRPPEEWELERPVELRGFMAWLPEETWGPGLSWLFSPQLNPILRVDPRVAEDHPFGIRLAHYANIGVNAPGFNISGVVS